MLLILIFVKILKIAKDHPKGLLHKSNGMISIMLIMGMSFVAVKGYEQKVGLNHKDAVQTRYITETGIAYAINVLKVTNKWKGVLAPTDIFGGTVTVACYDGYLHNEAVIVSTGTYRSAKKTITVSMIVPGR